MAERYHVCRQCLERSHPRDECLCPEIICGVDRCTAHHHPFLHPVVGSPLVGDGRIGLLRSIREARTQGARAVEQVLENVRYQDLHAIFHLRDCLRFVF